jgi:Rrf2 family transcriptional regulator, nitric oxide-sensitive transcriptional repressor
MQLTRHSDYSLRVLIFLAVNRDRLATIPQIAGAYAISRGHLMKVVQELGQLGYIETLRGRGGGLRLALEPAQIRLGDVVRQTEERLDLVECFSDKAGGCRIAPACRLKAALHQALAAFIETLNGYTLADVADARATPLRRLLQIA